MPALLERCDIPRQLLAIQCVDLSGGLTRALADRLAALLCGRAACLPFSSRLRFLHALQELRESTPPFDSEFTKKRALEISKRLTDGQFDALASLDSGGAAMTAARARDRRERDDADPAYGYTALFFSYTELQRDLGSPVRT